MAAVRLMRGRPVLRDEREEPRTSAPLPDDGDGADDPAREGGRSVSTATIVDPTNTNSPTATTDATRTCSPTAILHPVRERVSQSVSRWRADRLQATKSLCCVLLSVFQL
jgi:hypothetical protein